MYVSQELGYSSAACRAGNSNYLGSIGGAFSAAEPNHFIK